MSYYYYLNNNSQPSGDFEVHRLDCNQGADSENQLDLGICQDGVEAVAKAKTRYPKVALHINGCYYCCPESHTG